MSRCCACNNDGYVWLMRLEAAYDIGDRREKRTHWMSATTAADSTVLAGWEQPQTWQIWSYTCPCDCDLGRRRANGASTHQKLTGLWAAPGSCDRLFYLLPQMRKLFADRWGTGHGKPRDPTSVPAKANAPSRLDAIYQAWDDECPPF
jgi:hypothetical protein